MTKEQVIQNMKQQGWCASTQPEDFEEFFGEYGWEDVCFKKEGGRLTIYEVSAFHEVETSDGSTLRYPIEVNIYMMGPVVLGMDYAIKNLTSVGDKRVKEANEEDFKIMDAFAEYFPSIAA